MCLWRVEKRGTYTHTCSSTVQSWLKVSDLFGWQILPLIICQNNNNNTSISHVNELDGSKETSATTNHQESRALKPVCRSQSLKRRKLNVENFYIHFFCFFQCYLECFHWAECKCSHRQQRRLSGNSLLTAQHALNVVSSQTNNAGKNDSQNCCQK